MNKTKLSSKGQVIIPRATRVAHHWEVGQELVVIDTEEGVLLKPLRPVPEATLDELVGCLQYTGPAKSLADMEQAISKGAKEARNEAGNEVRDDSDDKY